MTYQIILCRFCISNNNKHLVVDILIWNRIAIAISRGVCYDGVVFDLELPYKVNSCL